MVKGQSSKWMSESSPLSTLPIDVADFSLQGHRFSILKTGVQTCSYLRPLELSTQVLSLRHTRVLSGLRSVVPCFRDEGTGDFRGSSLTLPGCNPGCRTVNCGFLSDQCGQREGLRP